MADFASRVAAAPRGTRPGRPQYPALDAWRVEFRDGLRTPYGFDPLWRAACSEESALEAEAVGLPGIAASYRRDAREIIRRAARAAAT